MERLAALNSPHKYQVLSHTDRVRGTQTRAKSPQSRYSSGMRLLPLLLVSTGCAGALGDDTRHRCIETYSAEDGYEFVGDGWHVDGVPPDGPDALEHEPLPVTDVESACVAHGHDCQGQIAVTRSAAACVAQEENMAKGIDGTVHADLMYDDTYGLPIWTVSNVLDQVSWSGESLHVDAIDASVLNRFEWSTPL